MSENLGCLVVDIAGCALSPEDRNILNHPLVGGLILFSRNYESPAQLKALTQSIRQCKSTPILIMVDQEGGRVQRFIDGFSRLPPAAWLGERYDEDKPQACTLAEQAGWLMAHEILAAGIDMSIAPVLDVNKSICPAIGTRAFHPTVEGVTMLSHAYIKGMHAAGMASVGKHFPGHGSVDIDSHLGIPIDPRSLDQVMADDLIPFTHLIQLGLTAMLAAHIIFPSVDSQPVGFSRYWLQQVLREQLGFHGPILTDDLNMEGANISSSYADRVLLAREAGCDLTLLCNNRRGVIETLDGVSYQANTIAPDRWTRLRGDFTRADTDRHAEMAHSFDLMMEGI